MKKQGSLHKGKLPSELQRRIDSGEARTRKEWADTFHVNVHSVDVALLALRKIGRMFYPVEGIVRDVVKSKTDYRETSERLVKNFTNPHIKHTFRLMEQRFIEDPTSRNDIELLATDMFLMVTNYRQGLLKGKAHEDRTTTSK